MGKRIDFNTFCQFMDRYTIDQQFVCWHVRDKSKPILERVYWGKAEDPGIFIVGCETYWKTNMKHYQKIMAGKAREEAEREMEWDDWFAIQRRNTVEFDDEFPDSASQRKLAWGFKEMRDTREGQA